MIVCIVVEREGEHWILANIDARMSLSENPFRTDENFQKQNKKISGSRYPLFRDHWK